MKFKIKSGKGFFKAARRLLNKHSADILTAGGLVCFGCSLYLTNKIAPKAHEKLVEAEEEKGEKLTIGEKVKTVGKDYIAPAVTAATGTVMIAAGNRIGAKKIAELGAEYELLDTVLKNYREETAKAVGDEKEADISHAAYEKAKNLNPAPEEATGKIIDCTTRLKCTDNASGVTFYASYKEIEDVLATLNNRLGYEVYHGLPNAKGACEDVSLNEYYDMYPAPKPPHSGLGEEYGWFEGTDVCAEIIPSEDEFHTPMWLVEFNRATRPVNLCKF